MLARASLLALLQAGSLHHKLAVLCGAGILPAICCKTSNLQRASLLAL
jgi:hypothetical protein